MVFIMIEVNKSDILETEQEFNFFTIGNSGSFTTYIFKALQVADSKNFYALAKSFPAHAFCIAREYIPNQLKHFKVHTEEGIKYFTHEELD